MKCLQSILRSNEQETLLNEVASGSGLLESYLTCSFQLCKKNSDFLSLHLATRWLQADIKSGQLEVFEEFLPK